LLKGCTSKIGACNLHGKECWEVFEVRWFHCHVIPLIGHFGTSHNVLNGASHFLCFWMWPWWIFICLCVPKLGIKVSMKAVMHMANCITCHCALGSVISLCHHTSIVSLVHWWKSGLNTGTTQCHYVLIPALSMPTSLLVALLSAILYTTVVNLSAIICLYAILCGNCQVWPLPLNIGTKMHWLHGIDSCGPEFVLCQQSHFWNHWPDGVQTLLPSRLVLGAFFWDPTAISEGVSWAHCQLCQLALMNSISTALLPPALLQVTCMGLLCLVSISREMVKWAYH